MLSNIWCPKEERGLVTYWRSFSAGISICLIKGCGREGHSQLKGNFSAFNLVLFPPPKSPWVSGLAGTVGISKVPIPMEAFRKPNKNTKNTKIDHFLAFRRKAKIVLICLLPPCPSWILLMLTSFDHVLQPTGGWKYPENRIYCGRTFT